MLVFSIILAAMSICFGAYCLYRIKKVQKQDAETERTNQELAQKKAKLIKTIDTLVLEKRMLEEAIRDKKEIFQSNESILEDLF
jgi:cell division protein FtsB